MGRPETDLHLHLDGSLSIDVVKTLADRIGYDFGGKNVKELLSVGKTCESLPDYLKCFDLPGILLQTEEALEYAACDLVKRLAGQGLVYAEIRFAPQLHKQKGLTQGQAVEAVVKGVRTGCKETGIYAGVLLCAMVNGSDAENEETMELAKAFCKEKAVNGVEQILPDRKASFRWRILKECLSGCTRPECRLRFMPESAGTMRT